MNSSVTASLLPIRTRQKSITTSATTRSTWKRMAALRSPCKTARIFNMTCTARFWLAPDLHHHSKTDKFIWRQFHTRERERAFLGVNSIRIIIITNFSSRFPLSEFSRHTYFHFCWFHIRLCWKIIPYRNYFCTFNSSGFIRPKASIPLLN